MLEILKPEPEPRKNNEVTLSGDIYWIGPDKLRCFNPEDFKAMEKINEKTP